MAVKISRLRPFQIGEKAADPRSDMFFKKLLSAPGGSRELTVG